MRDEERSPSKLDESQEDLVKRRKLVAGYEPRCRDRFPEGKDGDQGEQPGRWTESSPCLVVYSVKGSRTEQAEGHPNSLRGVASWASELISFGRNSGKSLR